MRTSTVVLAVALVSSTTPVLAAPIPDPVNAESSSDLQARGGAGALFKLLPKLFGKIAGGAAADAAVNQASSRRDVELAERAGAAGLAKAFGKGAAGSAAVGGFFGAIDKLFSGDENPQKRNLAERAVTLASLQRGPINNGPPPNWPVGTIGGGLDKLFSGEGNLKRAVQKLDVDTMIEKIEKSGLFTQEQLDEVEAELTKSLSSVHTRSLDARKGGKALGSLTKGLVGVLGSIAGSVGIDAVTGANARRAIPLTNEEIIAKLENSKDFTQAQLGEVEAELSKAMTSGLTSRSNLEVRAVRLGGLTKGVVGVVGSIAGSLGVDAIFGGDKAARTYEDLNALD